MGPGVLIHQIIDSIIKHVKLTLITLFYLINHVQISKHVIEIEKGVRVEKSHVRFEQASLLQTRTVRRRFLSPITNAAVQPYSINLSDFVPLPSAVNLSLSASLSC